MRLIVVSSKLLFILKLGFRFELFGLLLVLVLESILISSKSSSKEELLLLSKLLLSKSLINFTIFILFIKSIT